MAVSLLQAQHASRFIRQFIANPEVGVIGGYHGANLGDMALASSVKEVLDQSHIKSGIQTIYNLERWKSTPYAIIGGGAVGYIDCLKRVMHRYKGNYNKVSLLGVDFTERVYPEECIDFIKNVAFLSSRSKTQVTRLKQMTGRTDIDHHPDIAYSLYRDFCDIRRHHLNKSSEEAQGLHTNKSKLLLVNVLPLYADFHDGKILPIEGYRAERPELYDQFQQMHAAYKNVLRATVQQALDEGYKVETIPFTPEDGQYGKMILDKLPVQHLPYHSNPRKMMLKMATADRVIATRYHATIFAIKLGLEVLPIAYATKNESMLQELGIDRKQYLSTGDLAEGKSGVLPFIRCNTALVADWEQASADSIAKAIEKLHLHSAR
jgi:hypothetical protein